jgi:hypothetical protein
MCSFYLESSVSIKAGMPIIAIMANIDAIRADFQDYGGMVLSQSFNCSSN